MTGAARRGVRTGKVMALAVAVLVLFEPRWGQAQVIVGAGPGAEIHGLTTALGGSTALPGVMVTCADAAGRVVATTMSDGSGRFRLTGVPPGTCHLKAVLDGFQDRTDAVLLRQGQVVEHRIDLDLAKVSQSVDVVARAGADTSTWMATTLAQREGLGGSTLEQLPLSEGSIHGVLPLLAGVVQGPEGLSIRGGFPTQSTVQVGGASVTEPSSGETVVWLPADAVASIDVLPNPYAVEYGRFSSGVTVVQTRQGGNTWRALFQDFDPTIRRTRTGIDLRGIESISPRAFLGGPIVKDRLFLAQAVFGRYDSRDIQSRPQEERLVEHSLSTFSRLDAVLGRSRMLSVSGGVFLQNKDSINFNTFNPPDVAANYRQRAFIVGTGYNMPLSSAAFLESAVHVNRYRLGVDGKGEADMVLTPDINQGNYYQTQDRRTTAVQWLESVSAQRQNASGLHLLKAGFDLQHVDYEGTTRSRPIQILREDGTLAETIVFGAAAAERASNTDLAVFVQDRWQPVSRVLVEMGLRFDRDGVLARHNISPRVGGLVSLGGGGRITLRGGIGLFYERTPSAAGAFDSSETRTVTRFGTDGLTAVGVPVVYVPRADAILDTARSRVWDVEYVHRLSRQLLFRLNVLDRQGDRALIEAPGGAIDDTGRVARRLSSTGRSSYREAGLGLTYSAGSREASVSYVRSASRANLNAYSVLSGMMQVPVVNADEYAPMDSDVPNRLVARASGTVAARLRLFGALELRNGFPYSLVNERLEFVGPRNQGRAFPVVARLDTAIEYRFTIYGWHPWIGVRFWNTLNTFLPLDVQRNLSSGAVGTFYNHAPRMIRFTIRLER